jgi:hypothetical protein
VELRCTVLIEPAPPTISVELLQQNLYGDTLKTYVLKGNFEEPQTRVYTRVPTDPEASADPMRGIHLSNIGSKPGKVLMCQGITIFGCTSTTRQILVSPFSKIVLPLPSEADYLHFTKSKEVIIHPYIRIEGTTSTFNVNSGITFGAPIEKKEM